MTLRWILHRYMSTNFSVLKGEGYLCEKNKRTFMYRISKHYFNIYLQCD